MFLYFFMKEECNKLISENHTYPELNTLGCLEGSNRIDCIQGVSGRFFQKTLGASIGREFDWATPTCKEWGAPGANRTRA